MVIKTKTTGFILLLAFWSLTGMQAQIQALTSDVRTENGVVYFNGKPFTGTLYSDDDDVIPNDCECTLIEHYKNGVKDGVQQKFHPNGKLQFRGTYRNGKPVGVHLYYNEKGDLVQKIYYENGQQVKEEDYENGKLTGLAISANGHTRDVKFFYEDGQLKTHIVYQNDGIAETGYHKNGKIKWEKYYRNHQKHGTWTYYDENGVKVRTQVYEHGKLVEEGSWKNGQKDGKWYVYKDPGKTRVITYRNGEIKSTEILDETYKIGRFDRKAEDILLRFKSHPDAQEQFTILRVAPSVQHTTSPTVRKIKEKILAELSSRAIKVDHPETYADRYLNHIIQITAIDYEITPFTYDVTRTDRNGNKYTEKKKAYNAVIRYRIRLMTPATGAAKEYDLEASSEGNLGNALLRTITKNYPQTVDEAFFRAYRKIYPYTVVKTAFPYSVRIREILKKSSSRIRTVRLDQPQLPKGIKFAYRTKGKAKPVVVVKVTDSGISGSNAKVIRGGDWLFNHQEDIKNLTLIEY